MFRKSFLLIVLLIVVGSCNNCPIDYKYASPTDISDGLLVGTIDEVDLDAAKLIEMVNQIKCSKFGGVESALIYKKGKLVLEEYFEGYLYQWDAPNYFGEQLLWDRDRLHTIMSCAKSFTSACVGIAIDKGYIKSVDQSIFDYLPEHQHLKSDGKENITIEHLLTMTSGLAWNEWGAAHGTSANDIDRIYFECSDDPIKCVLERPLIHEPGTHFTYNGGGIIILGEIIKNASGMDMDAFSMKYLLEPLQVENREWYRYNNGTYATDGSLFLTSRAMLKIGALFLNDGVWNGERIISSEWIQKSSTTYRNNKNIRIPIEDSGKNDYGYTWWISELEHKGKNVKMYRANGWGGQVICVIPELEMAFVFTGHNYAFNSKLFKIVNKFILPATL